MVTDAAVVPSGTATSLGLRRVWLGAASAAVSHGLTVAQTFLLVPLFLRAWGAEGYGHWLILSTLVANLTLMDFGAQTYIGNLLAMHYARGETSDFRRVLSSGVSLFIMVGGFALVLIVGALVTFAVIPIPGVGRAFSKVELLVLLALVPVPLVLSVPAGIYVTVYRAAGRYARGSMIANIVRGLGLAATAAVLLQRISMVGFALLSLVIGVTLTAVIIWDSRRTIPECRALDLSVTQGRGGLAYVRPSLYFWLMSVAQTFNQHGFVLVVGLISGAGAVAVYATHRAISSIPNYTGLLLQGPLMPEMSALWARGDRRGLFSTALHSIRLVAAASGTIAVALWIAGPWVYSWWTRRELALDTTLLALLLTQAVLSAGWFTSGWVLLAINRHRTLAGVCVANAVLTICGAYAASRVWGLAGAVGASLAADVVCGLMFFPWLAAGALDARPWRLHAMILRVLAVIALAAAAAYLASPWGPLASLAVCSVILLPLAARIAREPGGYQGSTG